MPVILRKNMTTIGLIGRGERCSVFKNVEVPASCIRRKKARRKRAIICPFGCAKQWDEWNFSGRRRKKRKIQRLWNEYFAAKVFWNQGLWLCNRNIKQAPYPIDDMGLGVYRL